VIAPLKSMIEGEKPVFKRSKTNLSRSIITGSTGTVSKRKTKHKEPSLEEPEKKPENNAK